MTKKQKSLLTRIILGIVLFLAGMILERAVDAPWAYWTAVGLLLSDHLRCFSLVGAPRIEPDGCRYRLRPDSPRRIRVYHSVDRTFILEDFFAKLRYYFGS